MKVWKTLFVLLFIFVNFSLSNRNKVVKLILWRTIEGICVVAYLILVMKDGSRKVTLVTSRTKVASLSKVSTPRMELVAAQLQARLKLWLVASLSITIKIILSTLQSFWE